LTLPFAGAASIDGAVFAVSQLQAGYGAIYGYGGPPGGSSNGLAGFGTGGLGGEAVDAGQVGGYGLEGFGGDASVSSAAPGAGIYAGGGNAPAGGFAGDGIVAWPGSGATDNLTSGLAGYFGGPVNVNGNLAKAGGSFVIDHPTDPANKYLYHSFVESPDMKNIYDGNVVTDGSGPAVVKMPDWFEALNRDFRYQLTVIGQFAQAIVASKIANGQFAIKTDKPGVEVSWQVTGIRQDAWANAHRVPGEPDLHELHHPRPVKKQP